MPLVLIDLDDAIRAHGRRAIADAAAANAAAA
jgi:hypothetical protein